MTEISKKHRYPVRRRILIALGIILAALAVFFIVYVSSYYHADPTALAALESTEDVTVTAGSGGRIIFEPAGSDTPRLHTGLIFYPGGKVEYTAYAPLMAKLAKRGITCILLKVPFNLAIFQIDAANGVIESYNSEIAAAQDHQMIDHWYLGGHSLGGAAAGIYLSQGHGDEYDGLLLFGAYITSDLSGSKLSALSVIGEHDGLVTDERYEQHAGNLPADAVRYTIPGGCHAYFGSYGKQAGDGEATISADEQQEITADIAAEWLQHTEQE